MRLAVVVPSKTPGNVRAAVQSVRDHEQYIAIAVIDDGLSCDTAALPAAVLKGVKPFVFARNCNQGAKAAFEADADGVFLMNDDATLETPCGFTALAAVAAEHPEYGVISAAITDHVGNLNQKPKGNGLREEPRVLAYICVYIPRRTWEAVGPLDEGFCDDYGWEDTAYCREVQRAGLKLGIFDGCHVAHGVLPSTFRDGNRSVSVYNRNAQRYYAKYGDLCGLPIPKGWR